MGQEKRKKNSDDGRAFGSRVAALRKARGLTLDSLAALIGAPKSTVASWEAGHMGNNPRLLLELCKKISTPDSPISFQYLLTGEQEVSGATCPDLSLFFEKEEFVTGLCEVTIKRLVPKTQKKPEGGKS